jgi:hypothetical protein
VIGADNITLDLDGHVIDGEGIRAARWRPRRDLCDIGMLNESHDGVMSEMARSVHLGRAHSSGRHAKPRAWEFWRGTSSSVSVIAESALVNGRLPNVACVWLARRPRRKLVRWPIGEGRS